MAVKRKQKSKSVAQLKKELKAAVTEGRRVLRKGTSDPSGRTRRVNLVGFGHAELTNAELKAFRESHTMKVRRLEDRIRRASNR